MPRSLLTVLLLILAMPAQASDYNDLLQLFADWRGFEQPPTLDGAPDYTAGQFKKRYQQFQQYRDRLDKREHASWPIDQQVDWHLVRAEMNGFDFNYRVLKPWARDPAFYQSIWMERSDVPGHEGPTHHAVTEFWTYELPLSADEEQRLIGDLSVILPLTWEDEVRLLKRELTRAWSSLKLEEHRNRKLPPLVAAATPEEYAALAERSADNFIRFLQDEDILTYKDYMEPALREHLGAFVPSESRNFFWIAAHCDPTPLFTHFYHWFELARMDTEPNVSPIRRGALLYNIFDSRNEGTATGVEEMFMHAGLYDDNPRVREIVWIMLAQRAARGLGSLYAHANEMTMEEAGGVHMEWTPRGWMKQEKELLIFEQHLYLRQPGYGTSYITGKYLLEEAPADYSKQLEESGDEFRLKDFFDLLNSIDSIPIALGRWEMTGIDDEIRAVTAGD